MKTSENGIRFIQEREKTELKAYRDQAGYLTIGTGHLVLPGESYTISSTITSLQAATLLHNDLKSAEAAVSASIKVTLNQNQFDALVSFAFNVGDQAEAHSTLVKVINGKGSKDQIKKQFLSWEFARHVLIPGLEQRRILEYNLYTS